MLIEEIITEIRIEPYPIQTHFDSGHSEGPALVGEFTTSGGDNVSCFIFYKEVDDAVYINFHRNGSFNATGKGDQFKIFGTALEFFKDNIGKMLKKFKPSKLIFRVNNAEASRVALYRRRLVPALQKILPSGWNGPEEQTRQDGSISGTYFVWSSGSVEESYRARRELRGNKTRRRK